MRILVIKIVSVKAKKSDWEIHLSQDQLIFSSLCAVVRCMLKLETWSLHMKPSLTAQLHRANAKFTWKSCQSAWTFVAVLWLCQAPQELSQFSSSALFQLWGARKGNELAHTVSDCCPCTCTLWKQCYISTHSTHAVCVKVLTQYLTQYLALNRRGRWNIKVKRLLPHQSPNQSLNSELYYYCKRWNCNDKSKQYSKSQNKQKGCISSESAE